MGPEGRGRGGAGGGGGGSRVPEPRRRPPPWVAVVGDWGQHVSQLPQQMCCPLEMESLVPLMRCESKHGLPADRLIEPQSPSLVMHVSAGCYGIVQLKAHVWPRWTRNADKPASETLKRSSNIAHRHKGPEFYFKDTRI